MNHIQKPCLFIAPIMGSLAFFINIGCRKVPHVPEVPHISHVPEAHVPKTRSRIDAEKVEQVTGAMSNVIGGAGDALDIAVKLRGEVPESKSVDFSISDQLGEGQISETVEISMNGHKVGRFEIDEENKSGKLDMSATGEGSISYSIVCVSKFRTSEGDTIDLQGVGQGTIEVSDGDRFELEGSISGTTFLVTIKEL